MALTASTATKSCKSWAPTTLTRARLTGTAQHPPGPGHQSPSVTLLNGSLHLHRVPAPARPPRGSPRTPPCGTSCRPRGNPCEAQCPPSPAAPPSQGGAGPAWCFGHWHRSAEVSWPESSQLRTSCSGKPGCSPPSSCHLWSTARICSQHPGFWIGNLITVCGEKKREEQWMHSPTQAPDRPSSPLKAPFAWSTRRPLSRQPARGRSPPHATYSKNFCKLTPLILLIASWDFIGQK